MQKVVSISFFRERHIDLASFFSKQDDVCYCIDIYGLMQSLDQQYEPSEWRLFIDSNKTSLKAVLLHNGNRKPSVPIAYCTKTKETYEKMKQLLACIRYDTHQWHVCGDLKVIGLLLGLQMGYTKYMCFLCLWNSRADDEHYSTPEWPARTNLTPGSFNVMHVPLVNPKNIFLSPLHIKLGLIKNFVKAMDHLGQGFPTRGARTPWWCEMAFQFFVLYSQLIHFQFLGYILCWCNDYLNFLFFQINNYCINY